MYKAGILNIKTGKILLRKAVQLFNIFLFLFLAVKTSSYPLPERIPLNVYYKTDGLMSLCLLFSSGFSFFLLYGFIMITLVLLVGNFFCFWICPLGGCVEFMNIITLRKFWKFPAIEQKKFRKAGTLILLFVLISAIFSGILSIPFVGFIFDPFVILGQAMTLNKIWLITLFLIFVAGILSPRIWCNCFCPLGRFYTITGTLLKRKRRKNE